MYDAFVASHKCTAEQGAIKHRGDLQSEYYVPVQ
jgi:hypothetical protein